jgi:hypothetical protein
MPEPEFLDCEICHVGPSAIFGVISIVASLINHHKK